jgi:hypothetical protein
MGEVEAWGEVVEAPVSQDTYNGLDKDWVNRADVGEDCNSYMGCIEVSQSGCIQRS